MHEKIRVAVIFGGESAEHEISIRSANNIISGMDKKKYEISLIGITKNGRWYGGRSAESILKSGNNRYTVSEDDTLAFIPGEAEANIIYISDTKKKIGSDVIFPVLHGPMGEDGTVQGMLKLAGIPFVGSGVLGSSVGMDKDVMKRLFRDSGLPIAKYRVVLASEKEKACFGDTAEELGLPFFIKPANMGSSVGVHKVNNPAAFNAAIEEAFR